MKLIVDISDNLYNVIKSDKYGLHKGKMYDIIRDGIPLASVKAEIEKQIERDFAFAETETFKVTCHYGIANGLQNAIRFLDNIGKESEDE